MSVQVLELSKSFGQQKAVDRLSFEVKKGEILGFLGPNGAGKSTTMKMLTGFFPADQGTVFIAGFDMAAEPVQAKRCIGYLPENNALYPDLYIAEYLHYTASIHQLSQKKKAVEQAMELTGLINERKKKIGQLSKGYRQRVGLAQAIIHDPAVLILDEPTSGLDPNQLTEIRQLIRNLGREKTLILSTHIMQEVEAVCDRVLILNHGRVVANAPVRELLSGAGEVYTVEFEHPASLLQLGQLKGVLSVQTRSDRIFSLRAEPLAQLREQVFELAVQTDNRLLGLQKEVSSLESVFQNLTNPKE